MLRIGVIGYGYWGPNLARNFHHSPLWSLVRVADFQPARREAAARDCPGVETCADPEPILRAPDIDAVAIATPIATHFDLALAALRAGKHVLVEKPMTDDAGQAERLVAEADRRGLVLLVDHTFVYTEAVHWLTGFARGGQFGEPYYFDSIRANLGLFQRDASVLWDLAPHDLSILTAVLDRPVRSVAAFGASHAGSRVPDIAYLTLDLGDGCLAHFHVSWLSPVKVRRVLLAGSRKMVVFDDLESTEKLKVYDSGVNIRHDDSEGAYRLRVDYRVGDMTSPALKSGEALAAEAAHFARCILGEERPRTGGEAGLAVVRVLSAAEQSMRSGGEIVRL